MMNLHRYGHAVIPGVVQVEEGAGGLPLLHVQNSFAECNIYVYGAHVVRFKPRERKDLLWLSPYSNFREGEPIRGGIPVIFPWFGKHRTRADLPLHGFVRTRLWDIESTKCLPDGRTKIVFSVVDNESSRAIWLNRFRLELSVIVGDALEMALTIENREQKPFTCEDGFHTYFNVGNASQCEVGDFDGLEYIDRVKGDSRAIQQGPARFENEMVHAFMHSPLVCELIDVAGQRRVQIEQLNMHSMVLWNPGEEAATKNPEIQDTWDQFVCIESTNCLDCELEIEPGRSHCSTLKLSEKKESGNEPENQSRAR